VDHMVSVVHATRFTDGRIPAAEARR
jgi:hypothetical protein